MSYLEDKKLIKKLDIPQDLKDIAMSENANIRCFAVSDERATAELINIMTKDIHPKVRVAVVQQGYNLDALKDDYSDIVRCAVVDRGYDLEHFENDKSPVVRMTLVEQGYKLDKYVSDEHIWVRSAVARQGYGLDVLVHDENEAVRATVARQGYGLDVLVNDDHPIVRAAVAMQGYGLETLINDDYDSVRRNVHLYLTRHPELQQKALSQNTNIIGLEVVTNDFQQATILSAQADKIVCKMNDSSELRTFTCNELINNQDDKAVREALRQYREEVKDNKENSNVSLNKKSIGR